MVNYDALNALIALVGLTLLVILEWPRLRKILPATDTTTLLWLSSLFILLAGFIIGNMPWIFGNLRAIARGEVPFQQRISPVIAEIDFAQTGRVLTVVGGLIGLLSGLSLPSKHQDCNFFFLMLLCLLFVIGNGWYLIRGGFP